MAHGEWQSTTELITAAMKVLAQEWPMTIRQLFYRLVSMLIIENCLRDYQRVSTAMTKAREDGRVPYERIVDRSRASYSSRRWTNLQILGDVLEKALVNYRRDYWQDQPYHVEIWCEKDAVTGSIEPVMKEYGINIEAIRGFNSTTNIHTTAERLLRQKEDGKEITILYLGDWDPSGRDIERDLGERLSEYTLTGNKIELDSRMIEWVAIFPEDIKKFNLPPLRVKDKDPRSRGFKRRYGNEAVELDALPPTELRRRLKQAIDQVIDHDAWNRAKTVENAERETCKRYAGIFKEIAADCR